MSSSPPLQDENLYWRHENIMPTQQDNKQLAILLVSYGQIAIFAQGPALSLPSLHKNTCLMGHAGWDWNWEWLTVWVAVWA